MARSLQTAIRAASVKPGDHTLGIRAEAVKPANGAGPTTSGTVDVLERLGDRTLLYVRLKDGSVIVAEDAGSSRAAIGDEVALGPRRTAQPSLRRRGPRLPSGGGRTWLRRRSTRQRVTAKAAERRNVQNISAPQWRNALFVAPYLVVFVALLVIPLFWGIWISLHKADAFGVGKLRRPHQLRPPLQRPHLPRSRSATPSISSF